MKKFGYPSYLTAEIFNEFYYNALFITAPFEEPGYLALACCWA